MSGMSRLDEQILGGSRLLCGWTKVQSSSWLTRHPNVQAAPWVLDDWVIFLETCTTLPFSNWLIAKSDRLILSEVSAGWRGIGNPGNRPATEMS